MKNLLILLFAVIVLASCNEEIIEPQLIESNEIEMNFDTLYQSFEIIRIDTMTRNNLKSYSIVLDKDVYPIEFSMDSINWQVDNKFYNLKQREYTFYAKSKNDIKSLKYRVTLNLEF